MTFHNGKEFSCHQKITESLEPKMYFACPYHSWGRGLNEHTSGLVRQYLPKGERLDTISPDYLKCIADALNDRARKILRFRTPREVFNEHRMHIGQKPWT